MAELLPLTPVLTFPLWSSCLLSSSSAATYVVSSAAPPVSIRAAERAAARAIRATGLRNATYRHYHYPDSAVKSIAIVKGRPLPRRWWAPDSSYHEHNLACARSIRRSTRPVKSVSSSLPKAENVEVEGVASRIRAMLGANEPRTTTVTVLDARDWFSVFFINDSPRTNSMKTSVQAGDSSYDVREGESITIPNGSVTPPKGRNKPHERRKQSMRAPSKTELEEQEEDDSTRAFSYLVGAGVAGLMWFAYECSQVWHEEELRKRRRAAENDIVEAPVPGLDRLRSQVKIWRERAEKSEAELVRERKKSWQVVLREGRL